MQPDSLRRPRPIRTSADATHLLSIAVTRPFEHETLAFLLDDEGVGGVIIAVEGTAPPDAVLDVLAFRCQVGKRVPALCSVVVASVRPDAGLLPGDIDRWLEASDIAAAHGLTLLEWYVVNRIGFHCPRELLGEPPRWPVPV
jgi:hypothetical protein